MGIKDKERRNEYERRKWKERRDAKLEALGINPEERPLGGTSGNRGQTILPNDKTLPASIRLRRSYETDEEYRLRYGRERINHYNARNREKVAERARANYHKNHEKSRERANKWAQSNRESIAVSQKKYYENNKYARLKSSKEWSKKNPEKAKAYFQAWAKSHPEVFQASSARCRAQILRAAPDWVNWETVRKIYAKSSNHNRSYPDNPWQVDHIVPLNNPNVCGLHVVPNLRIIPKLENQKKGNRVDLDAVAEEQMAFLRAVGLSQP